MSTQPLSAAETRLPAAELAAAARVRELQQLVERARGVAAGSPSVAPVASTAAPAEAVPGAFAAALRAAGVSLTASSTGSPTEPSGTTPYDGLIEQAALRNGLDPAILHGLIQQESGFDPAAQSSAGAAGLTQLMPGTAASLGVANPLDPTESIEGGARYLSEMMQSFGGNTSEALAAYNAGPAAVRQYGGVPPYAETEGYVSKVLGYAESYRHEHPAASTAVAA